MSGIYSIEQLDEKLWQIEGKVGTIQFYGYSRERAIEMYQEEIEAKKKKRSKGK